MKEIKELDNLSYAIFLEIAFQAFTKVDPTNYDMYNREKFFRKIDKSYLILDDNSFWVYDNSFWLSTGLSRSRWELRGRRLCDLTSRLGGEIFLKIF